MDAWDSLYFVVNRHLTPPFAQVIALFNSRGKYDDSASVRMGLRPPDIREPGAYTRDAIDYVQEPRPYPATTGWRVYDHVVGAYKDASPDDMPYEAYYDTPSAM